MGRAEDPTSYHPSVFGDWLCDGATYLGAVLTDKGDASGVSLACIVDKITATFLVAQHTGCATIPKFKKTH